MSEIVQLTLTSLRRCCLQSAMERGDVEQVSWYTAMLPASEQVSCYAGFLTNISDAPQRRHALHLAHTVGLDTPAIAATTAAIIRYGHKNGPLYRCKL